MTAVLFGLVDSVAPVLIGLLAIAALLFGVAVSLAILAWAYDPGRIVPGWWRR